MSWKRYKMRDFPASWRPQKTCLTPFSMLFPILCALVSGSEFQHTDPLRKEFCGQMAGLVAEKGGNRLESSSRKAFLRGSFSPCERPKVERVRGWGGPCGEVTRVLWCGHEGVVVRSWGCCGTVTRASWYGHEGVVVRSRGCHEPSTTICRMMGWYVWQLSFVPTAKLLLNNLALPLYLLKLACFRTHYTETSHIHIKMRFQNALVLTCWDQMEYIQIRTSEQVFHTKGWWITWTIWK